MRISDWSSDVCSSDLRTRPIALRKYRAGRAERSAPYGRRCQRPRACNPQADPPSRASLLCLASADKAGNEGLGRGEPACGPPHVKKVDLVQRPYTLHPVSFIGLIASAEVDPGRSEERRVGEEWGSTCRSRWWP